MVGNLNSEIIYTDSLIKKYTDIVAVDSVSIHVKRGEIYGFLGLNGAGKTTTIRMLLGMIKPTSGQFRLFGKELSGNCSVWNQVGYMVERSQSYPNLSVHENLKVITRLRRLNDASIDEIVELLHLEPYYNVKARNLSQGNLQRLGLAKALIHKPQLLILDEPVNGLDPSGIVQTRTLFQKLAESGTTIFISSHILTEISRLANRIGIIHQGKLVRELFTDELEKELIKKQIINTTDNSKAQKVLKASGFEPKISEENNLEIADSNNKIKPEEISKILVEKDCPPKQLYKFTEDLEHYFLRIIGKGTL